MISTIDAREALEAYLLEKMTKLCTNGKASRDEDEVSHEAARQMERLFDTLVPFERVASALGDGKVSPPRAIQGAPESLRVSVEHRYALSRWPSFDFVFFESEEGMAWGQTFVRREGAPVPTIHRLSDVDKWTHVESEVRAALGTPESHEGWPPWETSVYRLDGDAFAVCYVFGLLQTVRRVETA